MFPIPTCTSFSSSGSYVKIMPWFKYYLFNQDELITLGLFCVWVSFNHITLLCYYPLPSFISLYHCLLNKIIVCFIILNIYASICVYTVSLSIRIFKLPWSFSFSFNKESQPHISHYLNPQWLFFPNRTYQLIRLKHIEKIWRAKESRRSRGRKLHTFGIAYGKGRWQRKWRTASNELGRITMFIWQKKKSRGR